MYKRYRRGDPRPKQGIIIFLPVVPLRDLAIATILAHLNHLVKIKGEDSYVNTISRWREQGLNGLHIIKAVWREGDIPVDTHRGQMEFLTYGSPTLRFALHLIQKHTLASTDDPRPKKILLGEALPVCAWFAVMHAQLSQSERSDMADRFNNPSSDLTVPVLLADVSIVGLNLHESCNTVFLMSIFRNLALEIQCWGRANRVRALPSGKYFRRPSTENKTDYLNLRWQSLSKTYPKFS